MADQINTNFCGCLLQKARQVKWKTCRMVGAMTDGDVAEEAGLRWRKWKSLLYYKTAFGKLGFGEIRL